jgi:hypothetical protein
MHNKFRRTFILALPLIAVCLVIASVRTPACAKAHCKYSFSDNGVYSSDQDIEGNCWDCVREIWSVHRPDNSPNVQMSCQYKGG